MQPWKMFIRSASVVTVLTAGALAAGQAVVPFANVSRGTSPTVEEPAPEEQTPVVDPAEEAPETDDTTTTPEPEAPAEEAPETEEPSSDPVVDDAPEVPEEDVTPVDVTAVPPAPVVEKAPKVKKDKKAKKEKLYDHNCDGHEDNGWVQKGSSTLAKDCPDTGRSAPGAPAHAAAPAAAPAAASDTKGRSGDAKQDGNNGRSEDVRQDGNAGRSASAPGRIGKSL